MKTCLVIVVWLCLSGVAQARPINSEPGECDYVAPLNACGVDFTAHRKTQEWKLHHPGGAFAYRLINERGREFFAGKRHDGCISNAHARNLWITIAYCQGEPLTLRFHATRPTAFQVNYIR